MRKLVYDVERRVLTFDDAPKAEEKPAEEKPKRARRKKSEPANKAAEVQNK